MFNLEEKIKNWRKPLEKHQGLEPGYIEELESHLRDKINKLTNQGYSDEEAFHQSIKQFEDAEEIADEFHKARSKKAKRPAWKSSRWEPTMLPNYLKVTFRNFWRNKVYAFINVFGLAVGLAACILIALYIQAELSYDDFHPKADRTYRVLREFDTPTLRTTISNTPPALAQALKGGVPNIDEVIRIARTSTDLQYGVQTNVVPQVVFAPGMIGDSQLDSQKFTESGFVWADPGFFEVLSFQILSGKAALSRPGTVVLSRDMATKYFPNVNPVGRTLQVGDKTLEVTGVMENIPDNSHLKYIDFVGSMETLDFQPDSWGYNNFKTYIVLSRGGSKNEVASQVNKIVKAGIPEFRESGEDYFIPHLQRITDIHLGQGVDVDIQSTGNILYVYIFGALAVFILLLSCINFANLSTARSLERANEVGIRKAFGAGRKQLIGQFLGESIMTSLCALLLALLFVYMALPLLNQIAEKSIAFNAILEDTHVLILAGLSVIVGVSAGIYPAFFLSGFEPTRALKGDLQVSHGLRLRQGLVALQFMISISILVCTGIVYQQLGFMRSTGLGFNKENIIVVENIEYLDNQLETFKQELNRIPGVKNVSSGYSLPGTLFFTGKWWATTEPGLEQQTINFSYVDWDYLETLDIELVAGRGFSLETASTDSMAVVLNGAAARKFGWTPREALGKNITMWAAFEYTVIGVMEDFHYESLHKEIRPLVFFSPLRQQKRVAVRVEPANVATVLTGIRGTWEQFSDLTFSYSFLADDLNAQYRSEERLASVFGNFAILAVIIACLGLFGLAAYTSQRRTKEIGIRKALGATVLNIVGLLSKDFIKLVLLGFLTAIPISWYMMNQWLQDFAYRIDIGLGIFLLAGITAVIIALITVSWQSIKAALANPVESLSSE